MARGHVVLARTVETFQLIGRVLRVLRQEEKNRVKKERLSDKARESRGIDPLVRTKNSDLQ